MMTRRLNLLKIQGLAGAMNLCPRGTPTKGRITKGRMTKGRMTKGRMTKGRTIKR